MTLSRAIALPVALVSKIANFMLGLISSRVAEEKIA